MIDPSAGPDQSHVAALSTRDARSIPAPLSINGVTLPDGTTTDLHIAQGRYVQDPPEGAEQIDAAGLRALPGLVDLHTHLREPGREDAETVRSGAAAAARGGWTAVCAMANTNPVTDTAEAAQHLHALAADADAQVVPIGAISKGLGGEELAELGLMNRHAGVRLFSDDGRCVADSRLMRRAFEYVRDFGGVLAQHAQDPALAGDQACCHEGEWSGRLGLPGWPPQAESVIVARDVQLAELTRSRLHVCHVTSAESVEVLRWAKARGIQVTAEVTPHHLLLTTDLLADYDTTFKVNPPLRTDEHVEALRAGLADGTIDAVATDHAPHAPQDKDHAFVDARPGMLGLEHALGVVLDTMVATGALDWSGVADRMSQAPARIAGLADQGQGFTVGDPASLVLIDPGARAVVDRSQTASLSRNNPYHGRELADPVVRTIWNGRTTWLQS
ncbi:dihydroorotase [Parenemella sanctibonifatiensis]|uniref:Dihydroorotase n=1 Tax=Parenemella sanctibonifatiensis TaxID=2016505 RepID=A0A255E8H7_9ACTN|nr:dihydroorotase [Parenemella sanctibonifatiensis]OYN87816.1 dihydroorotase [Parenemella sanctibonifatiensis]